jgi:DNA-binding NarL/FixJ family response regulator
MLKPLVARHFTKRNGSIPAPPIHLTARQRQTLQLIAAGKTNKEIATVLDVSTKTVEKHRSDLMQRIGVKNTAGLVRYAVENERASVNGRENPTIAR